MAIKLFLGVPGAGKTLAMQDLLRYECKRWPVFTIDRAGEWVPNGNPRWRGFPPNVETIPYDRSYDNPAKLEDLAKSLIDMSARMWRFQPPWEALQVAKLTTLIGNAIYADDEIDLTATYKGWLENPIRSMVHQGRHLPNVAGIPSVCHVYGAGRRPQNLHTDLTAMADEVYLFRVSGAATLKRVLAEDYIENPDDVRTLPNLQFVLWKSDGSRKPGFVKNPFV